MDAEGVPAVDVGGPANKVGGTADGDVEELDAGIERLMIDLDGPASGSAGTGAGIVAVLCNTLAQGYSLVTRGAEAYAPFASRDALRHCLSRMTAQVVVERDRRSES